MTYNRQLKYLKINTVNAYFWQYMLKKIMSSVA